MLSNEVYLGVARAGVYRNENAHPAIIGRDLWDRVQAARTSTPAATGALTSERLLQGLARLGEHDIADAPDVETMLDSLLQENELVVVDFSEAEFVDSSILYALMNSDRAARERGKTFRLQLGTALIVEKAFQLSSVSELLDCYPTREEALRVTETA